MHAYNVPDDFDQLFKTSGFLNVQYCIQLVSSFYAGRVAGGSKYDDLQAPVFDRVLEFVQHIETAFDGHVKIEKKKIESEIGLLQFFQRFGAVIIGGKTKAIIDDLGRRFKKETVIRIIIDIHQFQW